MIGLYKYSSYGLNKYIMWIIILSWFSFFSDDVRDLGFTVIIDMRGGSGSAWSTVKPILKVLQEYFPNAIHTAHLIKPDNFWQKQRTSMGSQKYKFEVNIVRHDSFDNSMTIYLIMLQQVYMSRTCQFLFEYCRLI